jgi:2-oxo-4-hydroxy-4-carboxy--5-ureidoimidazoline (OHCU) decarboxylase
MVECSLDKRITVVRFHPRINEKANFEFTQQRAIQNINNSKINAGFNRINGANQEKFKAFKKI